MTWSDLKAPLVTLCWLSVATFLYVTFGNLESTLVVLFWLVAVFFLLRFFVCLAWASSYSRGSWGLFVWGVLYFLRPRSKFKTTIGPEGRVYLERARFSLFVFLMLLLTWFAVGIVLSSMN